MPRAALVHLRVAGRRVPAAAQEQELCTEHLAHRAALTEGRMRATWHAGKQCPGMSEEAVIETYGYYPRVSHNTDWALTEQQAAHWGGLHAYASSKLQPCMPVREATMNAPERAPQSETWVRVQALG